MEGYAIRLVGETNYVFGTLTSDVTKAEAGRVKMAHAHKKFNYEVVHVAVDHDTQRITPVDMMVSLKDVPSLKSVYPAQCDSCGKVFSSKPFRVLMGGGWTSPPAREYSVWFKCPQCKNLVTKSRKVSFPVINRELGDEVVLPPDPKPKGIHKVLNIFKKSEFPESRQPNNMVAMWMPPPKTIRSPKDR